VTLPKASTSSGNVDCPEIYVGTFQAISLDGDVDFSISFSDPDVSAFDETPVADINAWSTGNDKVAMSICLSPDKETTFYATVVSYQFSASDTWHLRVVFTPSAVFYRIALRQIPFVWYNEFLTCKYLPSSISFRFNI